MIFKSNKNYLYKKMFSSLRNEDDEDYVPPIIERVQNIGGSTAAPGPGEKIRKMEEDFENDKKEKQLQIDNKALKRKRKREKKKIKKKIYQNSEKNKNIFSKDIPILEQIKNKMGKEEFEKLIKNDNKKIKFDNTEEINEIELIPKKGEQRIKFINKEKIKEEKQEQEK